MPSPTPLYQIEECPDLYVDACVCDEQRNLVFLSAALLQIVGGDKLIIPFC